MARYSATVRDQNEAPIPNVRITVTLRDGDIPVLTDDDDNVLTQPLTTDEYGGFYFNSEVDFYDLAYYYGGRLIQRDYSVPVGDPIEQGPVGPAGPQGEPGYRIAETWADLAAMTGTVSGEAAKIFADSGTHTDPVVGGTVQNNGLYSWSVSPAGWERVGDALADGSGGILFDPATVVSNAFTRIVLDQQAPTSGMINSQGGNDAVNMRIIQNMGRFTQGPTVQPNYFDTVIAFGFNMTGSFTPLNTAMPSGSYRIESKFAQGGTTDPFMSEYHVASHFATDWATAGEYRAITATVPHSSTNWDSVHCSVGQRAALQINWDWDNNIRIYANYTTAGGGVIDYLDGGSGQGHPVLRFNTNNKACFQQINAAGTELLDLLFYDANSALTTEDTGTLHLNGAVRTVGWLGAKAGFAVNIASGAAANTQLMNFSSFGAVTGSMGGISYEANASVKVESVWINGTAAGKNGLKFRTSNGDSYIEFRDETNARQFTWNYVASGAYFELNDAQQGGQFANKYAFRVDWTKFQVAFGYAPKLPISTVASLPAAATAGAASQQYVTDLNATTSGSIAAGGGSNAGVVVCDGTNWRIMTAW